MRTFDSGSATLTAEHGISIGRWEQYLRPEQMPFGAMWCVIPPGGRSDEDRHPETELVVVVAGSGVVESVGGASTPAPTGTAIWLDPDERHVVHNTSTDTGLVLLSLYWLPSPSTPAAAGVR